MNVKRATEFNEKWGWNGFVLDNIAKGDELLFYRHLTYPFSQIMMMGVRNKERELVKLAEHDARKAIEKAKAAKNKAKR